MISLEALLKEGTKALEEHELQEARLDAWLLLEYVTGVNRAFYFAHSDDAVDEEKVARYREVIERRACHVPLQHITHQAWFMGYEFYVNQNVLVPRQDTETLVEKALEILKEKEAPRILDMCTGSGCILLSLLAFRKDAFGVGADVSQPALQVAERNAVGLQVSERAEFVKSDLFSSPFFQENTGKDKVLYDILISNPPYIRSADIEELMEEVRDHDPRLALDGHEDGLYFYRKIVSEGAEFLKKDGWMLFEIGYDQGEAVSKLMRDNGFSHVQVMKDLTGLDRVVLGRQSGKGNIL